MSQFPVLQNTGLNLHFYDGKLGDSVKYIQSDIERVHIIPTDRKKEMFDKLTLKNRVFDILVRDCCAQQNDYDACNKLYVSDLLYLVCEKIVSGEEEYIQLLQLQLADMRTGMCVQGRTTRLFQCLFALN